MTGVMAVMAVGAVGAVGAIKRTSLVALGGRFGWRFAAAQRWVGGLPPDSLLFY